MFALPQAQMDDIEGSSFENPIHLPGVKADHFRSFLCILYPLCVLIDTTPQLKSIPSRDSRVYDKIFLHRSNACRRM